MYIVINHTIELLILQEKKRKKYNILTLDKKIQELLTYNSLFYSIIDLYCFF